MNERSIEEPNCQITNSRDEETAAVRENWFSSIVVGWPCCCLHKGRGWLSNAICGICYGSIFFGEILSMACAFAASDKYRKKQYDRWGVIKFITSSCELYLLPFTTASFTVLLRLKHTIEIHYFFVALSFSFRPWRATFQTVDNGKEGPGIPRLAKDFFWCDYSIIL